MQVPSTEGYVMQCRAMNFFSFFLIKTLLSLHDKAANNNSIRMKQMTAYEKENASLLLKRWRFNLEVALSPPQVLRALSFLMPGLEPGETP